ncbi:MAG TPA: hypothetical protein VGG30_07450, partial [Pirellulales bacterium]
MTDPANRPDPQVDPLLAAWLREAAAPRPPAADAEANDRAAATAEHLAQVRQTLLARLADSARAPAAATQLVASDNLPAGGLPGLWARHRLAVGGLAASIALAGALLLALHSGRPLSAMERMAKKLTQVTSYSYRFSGSNAGINDDGKPERRSIVSDDYWHAPDAFRTEVKIDKVVEDATGGRRTKEILEHFDEVSPPGKTGAFIDHRYKTFCRRPYDPAGFVGSRMYPWDTLRMIREGSYDVLADLGEKRIGETAVQGYRLTLKNPHDKENSVRDPVELWLDPETNLPVEFDWGGEREGWKHTDQATDFRWNIELDPKLFEPVIPPGYADITPPTAQSDLDQIAGALRLFAELSGGHYPQVKKFDSAAIRNEMLKLADSAAADKPEAVRDKNRQQIEHAAAGLNWIARILRNRFHSGYRALMLGPKDNKDKDQVLLWWATYDGLYRVFYGDLRTELLTEDQWSKLVPKEEIVGEPQSEQLSAMDRIAKKLNGVSSYSYRSRGTNTGINDDGKRETITDDWTVWWLAPEAYREEMKIVKAVEDAGGGNRTEQTLVHCETFFPAGKPGLYIDHRYKIFCWSPHEWGGSKTYPWEVLRMIREGSYDILDDLGTKRIGDTVAQGYRLALKNPPGDMHALLDPVELWVDPRTSLPLEFSWAGESE